MSDVDDFDRVEVRATPSGGIEWRRPGWIEAAAREPTARLIEDFRSRSAFFRALEGDVDPQP